MTGSPWEETESESKSIESAVREKDLHLESLQKTLLIIIQDVTLVEKKSAVFVSSLAVFPGSRRCVCKRRWHTDERRDTMRWGSAFQSVLQSTRRLHQFFPGDLGTNQTDNVLICTSTPLIHSVTCFPSENFSSIQWTTTLCLIPNQVMKRRIACTCVSTYCPGRIYWWKIWLWTSVTLNQHCISSREKQNIHPLLQYTYT